MGGGPPPLESFDGPAQLVGVDVGVVLGGVEVAVAEEFLDLAEVRAGLEELGGEDVAQGVGGDAFALVDACGSGVVAEGVGEDPSAQALAVEADESARSVPSGSRVSR